MVRPAESKHQKKRPSDDSSASVAPPTPDDDFARRGWKYLEGEGPPLGIPLPPSTLRDLGLEGSGPRLLLGSVPPAPNDRPFPKNNAVAVCFNCHLASGANGAALESFTRSMSKGFPRPVLGAATLAGEEQRIVEWKSKQASEVRLEELWRDAAPANR
jgi:hypothetical protein